MKCRWCEDPVPEGEGFCDDLCRKLHENHEAQKGELGPREWQKRRLSSHKNKVRSGREWNN